MRPSLNLVVALVLLAGCGSQGDPGPTGPAGPGGPNGDPGNPGDPGDPGDPAGPGDPAPGTGLQIDLRSATAAEGQAPTVTFKITDAAGVPIDLQATTFVYEPRFTIAYLQADGEYHSYYESTVAAHPYVGGPPVALPDQTQVPYDPPRSAPYPWSRFVPGSEPGVYTYTFSAPITGLQGALTHTVAAWATVADDEGLAYPTGDTVDFVPAGGTPVDRQVVSDAACNACHGRLQAHDNRVGVKACLTCHSSQTVDPETGNPVAMAVMIHKIHRGERLPSSEDSDPTNDYKIVGFQQAVHDFTDIAMPPSHSTHIEGAEPKPYGPGLERDCVRCHQGANADSFWQRPSRRGCYSCHDDIDMVTGVGHPLIAQAADDTCVLCHNAAPGHVDIVQRHSINYDWFNDFMFTEHTLSIVIDDVTHVAAGEKPELAFTILVDGQPYNALTQSLMGALSFTMVGMNGMDFTAVPSPASALLGGSAPRQADPTKVVAIDAPLGKFRFTFPTALAVDATGTFGFGGEAYVQEVNAGVSKPAATRILQVWKNIGNTPGTARRVVIDNGKCNACHVELGFHGSHSRMGEQYCSMCHNPTLDNRGRMRFNVSETKTNFGVPQSYVVQSVDIGVMSHKIHMGEELAQPYKLGAVRTATVHNPADWPPESGGPGEAIADFSEKAYPNQMGRCDSCHVPNGWAMPSGTGLLPITRAILECGPTDLNGWCTGRTVAARGPLLLPRQGALCTSCHDSTAAVAHAEVFTLDPDGALNYNGNEVETCSTCHGPGGLYDSLKVHRNVP